MLRGKDQPSHVVAASAVDVGSGGKATARLLGSTMSGVTELLIFHPVDTIAKRLMTNKTSVWIYIFSVRMHFRF